MSRKKFISAVFIVTKLKGAVLNKQYDTERNKKITHCKLKKKYVELLRFFVLNIARSGRRYFGHPSHPAALFYRKSARLSTIVTLADEAWGSLHEPDESDFGDAKRRDASRCGRKSGCLRHSETHGRSIPLWWIMPSLKRYPVIKKKIAPDSIVYTDSLSSRDKLTWAVLSITALTIPSDADRQTTLTALRTLTENASYENTMESIANLFPLFWKKECEFSDDLQILCPGS